MDSAFIHQAANELVQNVGTRNIKQIARSCSLDISETSRIKDMLGLLSLYFDKPLILINRQLDKQTKQMVCGYALGHYLEHQLLMDLHTLNKFLTIKDKHILLYEHNAFTSHLMLDSDEVYQMTKRGLDAAQIAAAKGIHLNLVLVKLLELHHLGYDLRHYHALCISVDDLLIDSLHYSVSTSNTELHRLLLDCNETEQEIIIRTAKELKATLVSLGI